jgi:hypothetical protein
MFRMMRSAVVALSLIIVCSGAKAAEEPQKDPASEEKAAQVQDAATRDKAAQDAAFRKQVKEAIAAGKDTDVRVKCTADDQICTPTAIFFSKPEVSFVEIRNLEVGKPLTLRISAGELRRDDTIEKADPIFIQRKYETAPDVVVVALRKVARKAPAPKSGVVVVTNPVIDFGLLGRSPALLVQLQSGTDAPVTIQVDLRYQRWFADMGGFLVFNTVVDEELVTHTSGTSLVVDKKREKDSFTPATGAVLNFYAGSYPVIGGQFGFATNNNRQPSYFLGGAYRLRELRANALLTIGGGVAAVPSLRFPDVKVGDARQSDDAVLKGTTSYRFGPYLSLSFGFSFGDTAPQAKTGGK